MRRPYHRTLWTYLQLQEQHRIDALLDRARSLSIASLFAIAFHEPHKLADEHQRLKDDCGLTPTPEQVLAKLPTDVIDAMARVDRGEVVATPVEPSA